MYIHMGKKILVTFCIIFTVATIISCVINLALGQKTDTYIHIIDRAVLTLLGSGILVVLSEAAFKHAALGFFVPYLIFISLALLYVFITGFFTELHPNAYRDIFLNDTIAYIVVYFTVKLYERIKKKR